MQSEAIRRRKAPVEAEKVTFNELFSEGTNFSPTCQRPRHSELKNEKYQRNDESRKVSGKHERKTTLPIYIPGIGRQQQQLAHANVLLPSWSSFRKVGPARRQPGLSECHSLWFGGLWRWANGNSWDILGMKAICIKHVELKSSSGQNYWLFWSW